MKAFKLVEKKSQDINANLVEADQDKKSVEATLEGVERQAETQRKLLHQVEDNLTAARS